MRRGTLATHPRGGIIVPVVATVPKNPGRLTQTTCSAVPVYGGHHRLAHERAPPPRTRDGVDLGNDRIVQFKMHSHVYLYGADDNTKKEDGGHVNDARSESPISTPPPGKYSRQRSVTRCATSGRQASSRG